MCWKKLKKRVLSRHDRNITMPLFFRPLQLPCVFVDHLHPGNVCNRHCFNALRNGLQHLNKLAKRRMQHQVWLTVDAPKGDLLSSEATKSCNWINNIILRLFIVLYTQIFTRRTIWRNLGTQSLWWYYVVLVALRLVSFAFCSGCLGCHRTKAEVLFIPISVSFRHPGSI